MAAAWQYRTDQAVGRVQLPGANTERHPASHTSWAEGRHLWTEWKWEELGHRNSVPHVGDHSGRILVDGLDISHVDREDLRWHINVNPKDAFHF